MFKQARNTFIGVVAAMIVMGSLATFRYFIEKQTTSSTLDIQELHNMVEAEMKRSSIKYHFVFIGGCEHQLYVNGTKVEQLTKEQRRAIAKYLTDKTLDNFDQGNVNLYDIVSTFSCATYEADDKKPTDCGKIWSKTTWDL
jgi:O-methyltransferase involved in polyketide biosynthesis